MWSFLGNCLLPLVTAAIKRYILISDADLAHRCCREHVASIYLHQFQRDINVWSIPDYSQISFPKWCFLKQILSRVYFSSRPSEDDLCPLVDSKTNPGIKRQAGPCWCCWREGGASLTLEGKPAWAQIIRRAFLSEENMSVWKWTIMVLAIVGQER